MTSGASGSRRRARRANFLPLDQVAPVGTEHPPETHKDSGPASQGGAESGAVSADVLALAQQLAHLTPEERRALLKILRAKV